MLDIATVIRCGGNKRCLHAKVDSVGQDLIDVVGLGNDGRAAAYLQRGTNGKNTSFSGQPNYEKEFPTRLSSGTCRKAMSHLISASTMWGGWNDDIGSLPAV
jgi:hypothetical protein